MKFANEISESSISLEKSHKLVEFLTVTQGIVLVSTALRKRSAMIEHKRTENHLLRRKQAVFHLLVTMNAEEKINICADFLSLHQEQLLLVSVLQHAAKNFANRRYETNFPSSQYLAFLAPRALKNIIRYLKIHNIQNVKNRMLIIFFLAKKHSVANEEMLLRWLPAGERGILYCCHSISMF